MNNSKEIWRDIQGYNGRYKISNLGKVLSIKEYTNVRNGTSHVRKTILKPSANNSGYLFVSLRNKQGYKHYYIHRLVAEYFLPNVKNLPTVNHIDGDKLNNHYSNLEWASYSANNKHAYDHGLKHSNKNNRNMSTKVKAFTEDEKLKYSFPSMREAERKLNLANGTVHMAIKKGWHYAGLIWEKC